ncbi:DUF3313 family protein [Paraglaciecola hydrolytica]|uniref:DUF3313 domain-containing protein n=1 Tax=Paraglaciecola hydrolytica TaxID=1799789 RepID=A0A136A1Z2_9ALTE|nr:DUF3313 family protein [Paraglaciecola hydrolytica]KXI29234.1 hypothetical protein AX660_13895 [Paraglaciecola hydrolytica]
MNKFLCVLVIPFLTACSSSKQATVAEFSAVPQSAMQQLNNSHFDRFVVSHPEVFSRYNKVIFFPMQFDRLTVDSNADKDLRNSWYDSSWDEMDSICQYFDDFAQKIFNERAGFSTTLQGGKDVLAVEFRLKNFMPYNKRYKDNNLGTVGVSSDEKGIGTVTFQAVIADSQSGELLAVIEDGMEVNTGNIAINGNLNLQVDSNNKTSQNQAWRKVFKRWVEYLHDDLSSLQSSSLAQMQAQGSD